MVNIYAPTKAERKRLEDLSVVILTPCKDYECATAFTRSVVNMVAYSWLHGLKVYQMGTTERMVVHWGRNQLAGMAREHINGHTGQRYSHVLWLDDDHVFNPDMLLWLARNSDRDMVSAVYYGRAGRHLPVVYVKDNTPDKYMHFPLVEIPRTLFKVDAVGFGALLMRMDVLDRMEHPWFRFNEAGEDIYFCVQAKERGIDIYCDGEYRIGHIGDPKIIAEAESLKWLEDNREVYGDRVKIQLGGQGNG